jgi:hypothetical protein
MEVLTFVGRWALATSIGQRLESTVNLFSTHTLLSLKLQNIESNYANKSTHIQS